MSDFNLPPLELKSEDHYDLIYNLLVVQTKIITILEAAMLQQDMWPSEDVAYVAEALNQELKSALSILPPLEEYRQVNEIVLNDMLKQQAAN